MQKIRKILSAVLREKWSHTDTLTHRPTNGGLTSTEVENCNVDKSTGSTSVMSLFGSRTNLNIINMRLAQNPQKIFEVKKGEKLLSLTNHCPNSCASECVCECVLCECVLCDCVCVCVCVFVHECVRVWMYV